MWNSEHLVLSSLRAPHTPESQEAVHGYSPPEVSSWQVDTGRGWARPEEVACQEGHGHMGEMCLCPPLPPPVVMELIF